MVAVEAMAAGKLVLASKKGNLRVCARWYNRLSPRRKCEGPAVFKIQLGKCGAAFRRTNEKRV